MSSKHYWLSDTETGDGKTRITARDIHHAREQAEAWLDEWECAITPVESTMWISATIKDCGGEYLENVERQIDPPEPDCAEGETHEWGNSKVYGKGCGVVDVETCATCGKQRVTDTSVTNPSNGRQGYTAVRYRAAD